MFDSMLTQVFMVKKCNCENVNVVYENQEYAYNSLDVLLYFIHTIQYNLYL